MKVSLKWLKEYIDLKLPASDLAKKLTLAGTEVAHIDVTGGWENVFVARLVDINPHPNANRLRLATVEMEGVRETVVCGAPNLTIGDKVAFARVGARLIDGHTGERTILKPASIRGVLSQGMICSEKELGLSDNHEGILVLPAEAPVGMPLADYMGDVIFDLEVTPNRPDMLSMLGVAHEVAALTAEVVREPALETVPGGNVEPQLSIEITAPDLCPRYTAALVTGVRVGESPRWLQERLATTGIRSINNVVDITNLVMLEYGQPLHAFDYDRIGHRVMIRRAGADEVLTTLDGVSRKLDEATLVIADSAQAMAIAGVMGGAASEIADSTLNILLESASFKPASIHRTAARLKMSSEASQRFERGISPELTMRAARRAVRLLEELCGGTFAGMIDQYPGKNILKSIPVTEAGVKRILGMTFDLESIEKTLLSLGFSVEHTRPGELQVKPPYWRSDIHMVADVIEEIARINGYDCIPFTRLSSQLPEYKPAPLFGLKKKVRDIMAGFGACELMTYSITSRDALQKGLNTSLNPEPLHLVNPMAADQEYMRTSLRGSVLSALSDNLKHTDSEFIFELGRVYLPQADDLPLELEMLCSVMTGAGPEKVWRGRKEPLDFYDAKGVIEGLMRILGVNAVFKPAEDPGLKPGSQAVIKVGDATLGILGAIHPQVAQSFELPLGVYLFELNVTALLEYAHGYSAYKMVSRFPAVERDLALIVDDVVTHQQIIDIIDRFPLVQKVTLFDVYSGKQIARGKKSLAYSLILQSDDHTLRDAEIDGVMQGMVKRLETELGAKLRG
jgi:phenylalanyl-tRNA synthetase beta chain